MLLDDSLEELPAKWTPRKLLDLCFVLDHTAFDKFFHVFLLEKQLEPKQNVNSVDTPYV